MNITSKIEGYANLSPEEKLAKLEALEIEDSKDEIKRYKDLIDKASGEASAWKKKYNEKLTEQEKAELERKEKENAILEELKGLREEKEIAKLEANYLGLGYPKELANETAKAYYNGDIQRVFANQKAFLEDKEARVRAELLSSTPKPDNNPKGNVKTQDEQQLAELRKFAGLI